MNVVILAAGIGTRLKPITDEKPKALVQINNKPILGYALDSLLKNDINKIIICVGYKSNQIKNFCEINYPNLEIKFVNNKKFDTTNNMYSLYLARKFFDDDIIVMNGDIVYDQTIMTGIRKYDKTTIAVDTNTYDEESMKVIVDRNNEIQKISKTIPTNISYGCSLDIYKIKKNDLKIVKDEIIQIIEKDKNLNLWTEVLLDNLFQKKQIKSYPFLIKNKKWFEIDSLDDLVKAEILFNKKLKNLKRKKIFFLDRDGTLTLGNKAIIGVNQFIQKLKEKNKIFYVLSNNSSKTPDKHVETLRNMGLEISSNNILVSIQSAISFLKEKNFKNIFWVANKQVSYYLKKNNFTFNKKNPEAILLTYDTEINYNKLVALSNLVRKGIPYYATHNDIVCPTPKGNVPDIGTFIELIKLTTNKSPDKIFGKPERSLIDHVLKKHNLAYDDAVIIGDRLYTDIKLGKNSKITTTLVLSGETTRADYEKSTTKADIVIRSIKDLIVHI